MPSSLCGGRGGSVLCPHRVPRSEDTAGAGPWPLPCERAGYQLHHPDSTRSSSQPRRLWSGSSLALVGVSLSLPVQGVPPPPRRPQSPQPSSTSGAVGWSSVCFLLFAKGSHSLSSAVFIIGLGKHLPQPPTVPVGCQVTHYTVHPLRRRVPLLALARCAHSCPCQRGTAGFAAGRWGCGASQRCPRVVERRLRPRECGHQPSTHGLGHLWDQQA